MRLASVFTISLLLTGLTAQETGKEVFDQVVTSQKDLAKGGRPNREQYAAWQKSIQGTLTEKATLLASGEGVFYRGRLQIMAGDRDAGVASLKAFLESDAKSDLANDARVLVAGAIARDDKAGARKLLAAVDAGKLSEDLQRSFDGMQSQFKAEDTRDGLTGKLAPAIPAQKVLGGDAAWNLASLQGKVVVVDFWATWCPPCRAIIPGLVELQAEHADAGLQIVGVTKFYGSGMDFAADSELPHGGKSIGGRKGSGKEMTHEQEIEVNEHFISAFHLNYPVVFTNDEIAGDLYGVTGIPTCYVIGRDGKVVGHIVGGGDQNHEKLVKMIETALHAPVDASSTK